jgi:hypothetical protein
MKTEDLIGALAADVALRGPSMRVRLALALTIGGAISATLFAFGLGVRPDLGAAMHTWRFDIKVVTVLAAFLFALWAVLDLARPQAHHRKVLAVVLLAPALLAIAVGIELLAVPPQAWLARAVGSNSRICLVAVPILALAPLAGLLAALRAGAPRSPSLAGAGAGLLAGSLAAMLYATHCVDDSPLFVAAWYTPAIAVAVLLGSLAGRRMLRW